MAAPTGRKSPYVTVCIIDFDFYLYDKAATSYNCVDIALLFEEMLPVLFKFHI